MEGYWLYAIIGAVALVAIIVIIVLAVCLRKHKIEFVNAVVKTDEEVAPIKARRGQKITLPVLMAEGYEFVGWFYDAKCTELADIEKMPKNDVVLYAGWRRKKKEKPAEQSQPMSFMEGISHNLAFRIAIDW